LRFGLQSFDFSTWLVKDLSLVGLLEYFAVTSTSFQSQIVLHFLITICTAQLQRRKELMLATISSAHGK
jgi:hypothetical protein